MLPSSHGMPLRGPLLLCFVLCAGILTAQVNPDVYTLGFGDTFPGSVLDNDELPSDGQVTVSLAQDSECFVMNEDGQLSFGPIAGEPECCGTFTLWYIVEINGAFWGEASITINVDCGKPDCSVIDLSPYLMQDAGDGQGAGCISVCEESVSTLSVPFEPGYTYDWTLSEPFTVGVNDATIDVTWGAAGASSVQLEITDLANVTTSYNICVDILPAPEAQFLTSGYACLNAPMTFENVFPYAATYEWDFGDGTVVTDDGLLVQHTYDSPGNYTVTLTATAPIYGADGEALCCCTSEMTTVVTVDPLEGPQIECVSTLCEGDEATYTTEDNCTSYTWTATDADGNIITTLSGSDPEFTVNWGVGPYGLVTLETSGCTPAQCSSPTTVVIPIISSNGVINGPEIVCAGETATYTLPKWLSVVYDWNVTGGTILDGNGTHTVTIQWGSGPAGSIDVNYQSDFLQGLNGNTLADCMGTAALEVDVLPPFDLSSQTQSCVDGLSYIYATSTPSGNYDWSIDPAIPFTDNGSWIVIEWTDGPGTYTVTATPQDPGVYCNTEESVTIQVYETPLPTAINGPDEVCLGDTYTYTGEASLPGASLNWVVEGGTPTVASGSSVSITWSGSAPYRVGLLQTAPAMPFCQSDTLWLDVSVKTLDNALTLTSGGDCNNTTLAYSVSPAQPSGTVYTWTVAPAEAGSIVDGQGSTDVDVQWNDYAGPVTLEVVAELCGQTVSEDYSFTLLDAQQPVISMSGFLCPGGTATLQTTMPFSSYLWGGGQSSSSISINLPGVYEVTTQDANGCEATAYFEAEPSELPVASISSPDPRTICVDSPHVVDLVAETGTNYEFTWYCNGTPVQGPNAVSTFTHPFQDAAPSSYLYYAQVQNTVTGCTDNSNTITVFENECEGDTCTAENYTLMPTATLQSPNCDFVDFAANATNVSSFTWSFGDGLNGAGANTTHQYAEAGCYSIQVSGLVPNVWGTGSCTVTDTTSICVPIASDFTFESLGCNDVQFNQDATFLDAPYGGPITSYDWVIDGNPVSGPNPLYSFPGPGTYNVSLTVSNAGGCQATANDVVIVDGVGPASISVSNTEPCVGETVTFTASAPGAVSFNWIFGDGASFEGNPAEHVYSNALLYPVTLIATGPFGCTDSTAVNIDVQPGVPAGEITGDLEICEGELTTLSAPTGFSYLWNTGATSPSISVGAGTYSVELTNASGCSLELEAVTVTELPAPMVAIDGDAFICDAGCTTLSTFAVGGYTYEWFDDNGLIPGATSSFWEVCSDQILPNTFRVVVTDANGCTATSDPFTVDLATSPPVGIINSGDGCAGGINTLDVNPVTAGVNYAWSNGETGTTIDVSAAGTYSVTATDPATGCSSVASTIIHPLPDLCSVPVGCYEDCDSTTICIAEGLGDYQWYNQDGLLPGETAPCITITESGEYTVEVTTPQGCTDMSGVIEMTIVPCDPCDEVQLSYAPLVDADGNVDSCCVSIDYDINQPELHSMRFTTSDADLSFDPLSLGTGFSVQTNTATEVRIASNPVGQELPQGVQTNVMNLCLTDATVQPQTVLVDWLSQDGEVLCQDSILFDCPSEPDCLYLLSDSVYCEAGETFYTFTACNPADAAYSVGYIELTNVTPAGLNVIPNGIDLTTDQLAPGECRTFTVQLTGAVGGGVEFCYTLTGHDEDPNLDPTTECCTLEEVHCTTLPQCDPCDDVWVDAVLPTDGEGCCYTFDLVNNFDPAYFDEINVTVATPGVTVNVNNPVGSGWLTATYTPTSVSFVPDGMPNNFAPIGLFSLPELCFETTVAPTQEIIIQWMQDGVVVCEDVVEVFCEPDCGYLSDLAVECDPDNGLWNISGTLHNTADYTVGAAVISFPAGSGLSGYTTTIPLGSVPPGGVFGPIDFSVGAPAQPGDILCFNVTIHEIGPDGLYLNCCTFTSCVELPDCGFSTACNCDETFFEAVAAGINCVDNGGGEFVFSLAGAAALGDCDQVRWGFGDGFAEGPTAPDVVLTHAYSSPGTYEMCVKVYRQADDGTQCADFFCKEVEVLQNIASGITIFPNPTEGMFRISLEDVSVSTFEVTVFDATQRPVSMQTVSATTKSMLLPIDLSNAAQGIYFVQIKAGEELVTKQIIVSR